MSFLLLLKQSCTCKFAQRSRGQKSEMSPYWAKIKDSILLWMFWGKKSIFLFRLVGATPILRLLGSFHLYSQQELVKAFSGHVTGSGLLLSSFTCEHPWGLIGPPGQYRLISPFKILNSITSAEASASGKVTC